MPRTIFALSIGLLLASSLPLAPPAGAADQPVRGIDLLSRAPSGGSGDGLSFRASVSADGSKAVFFSYATNFVTGDTNEKADIFLRDRTTGTTTLVSRGVGGAPADGHSYGPAISRDGRLVLFESSATNLVPGDEAGINDLFIYDVTEGQTRRVTLGLHGEEANGTSWFGVFSPDATSVAFWSAATNLVTIDSNSGWDVFVYDLTTERTELVSLDGNGAQASHWAFFPECYPSLSADAAHVAFCTEAELTGDDVNASRDVYVRDRSAGRTELVSLGNGDVAANGWSSHPGITPDGRHVSFWSAASNLIPGDSNGHWDVFVHDRLRRMTERVSVGSDGVEGDALADATSQALSDDGRFVAFESLAGPLRGAEDSSTSHVYVHDRMSRTTSLLTAAGAGEQIGSQWSSITPDGKTVVFESDASVLADRDGNNDWDVFAATSDLVTSVSGVTVAPAGAGTVAVAGTATFTPVRLSGSDDEVGDATPPFGATAEISGASVSYRPAEEELVFSLDVADLRLLAPPETASGGVVRGVAGSPATTYVVSWTVEAVRYELRAGLLEGERPRLYSCAASCTLLTTVDGTIGSVGNSVVASVPLSLLPGATGASSLHGIRAATIVAGTTVDEVAVPSTHVPTLTVSAGHGPAVDDAGVAYELLALDGAVFSGTIPAPTVDRPVVWVRACIGTECRTKPVTLL